MSAFIYGAKMGESGVKSEYKDRRTAAQIAADKRQAKIADAAYKASINNPMSAHSMKTTEIARRAQARANRDAGYSAFFSSAHQQHMRAQFPNWEAVRQRVARNKTRMVAKKEAEKTAIRADRANKAASSKAMSGLMAMKASAAAKKR